MKVGDSSEGSGWIGCEGRRSRRRMSDEDGTVGGKSLKMT